MNHERDRYAHAFTLRWLPWVCPLDREEGFDILLPSSEEHFKPRVLNTNSLDA